MNQLKKKFNDRFPLFLMIFIILQPILDIITSVSIIYYQTTVTIGIVVRLLFMFLAIFYILLSKMLVLRRVAIIFLSSLLLIISIGFLTGFIVKDNFSLFAEAQFYAKGFYFSVMFISYTLALVIVKDSIKKNLISIVMKPIVVAMTIVGLVFLVAKITGTGFDTYKYLKAGTKSWFNAGNEIGAILSICLPVVILYGIKYTEKVRDIHFWIPSLLVIFSLVMLGTKVGYLSVMVTMVLACFFLVIKQIKKTADRSIKPSLVITTFILATVIIITPYTPAFSNTDMHINGLDNNNVEEPAEKSENILEEVTGSNANLFIFIENYAIRVINVLLSGRQIFLVETHQMFLEAPLLQKLFGMGYAGNYLDTPKLVEMDFLDLFYSYGIVGFFVFLLPFIYAITTITINFKLYKSKLYKLEFGLVLCSLVLGLAIAFIAGHVLFAPAVSIYLAVLLAYIFADFELVKKS